MSLFECLHVRFDSFSKFFSIFFFQVSGKHLKGVPLLGFAKAKALILSNANLLAEVLNPNKSAPCRITSLTFSFVFCQTPASTPCSGTVDAVIYEVDNSKTGLNRSGKITRA